MLIQVDSICTFWHKLKQFLTTLWKIWYFKHNTKIFFKCSTIFLLQYARRKNLLCIVKIESQELKVGKTFKYDAEKAHECTIGITPTHYSGIMTLWQFCFEPSKKVIHYLDLFINTNRIIIRICIWLSLPLMILYIYIPKIELMLWKRLL